MGLSLKKRLTDNFLTRGASRAFDQANVFDDGRSWQQRTPTVKQSVGGQVQNIFDANNKADVASRVSQGQPAMYRDQQQLTRRDNVQSVEENPFKRVYQEAVEAPRRIGFGLARNTTQQAETDQSTLSYQQTRDNVLLNAQKKIKDPFTPVAERQRLVKYLQSEYPQAQQDDFNTRLELERNVKDADPVAGLAALAEMGVDVATLGMGGVVFKGSKQAAKQGFKQAAKYTAKNIIKPVVPAAVGGALGAVTSQGSDVTPQQIAMGAGAGATLAVAFPAVGTLVGTGSKAINAKIKPVEAFYDPKVKPKVTLKNSPKLDPLESLKQEARKYRSAEEYLSSYEKRYHQTSKEASDAIKREGFRIDNRTSGENDILPIGVNTKRTTKDLGLGDSDNQLEVYFDKSAKIKSFSNRDQAEQFFYAHPKGSKYREAIKKSEQLDIDYQKQVDAVGKQMDDRYREIYAKGIKAKEDPQYQALRKQEESILEDWGKKVNVQKKIAQSESTRIAKEEGLDAIDITEDIGSFGRVTDNTIVFDPTKVKTRQQLTDLYNQATQSQPPKSPLTVEKNVAPNPEPLPVVKPKVEFKAPDQIKAAQKQTLESIAEKPKVSIKESKVANVDPTDPFGNRGIIKKIRNEVGSLVDDDAQMINLLRKIEKDTGQKGLVDQWYFDTGNIKSSNSIANAKLRQSEDLKESFGGLTKGEIKNYDDYASARAELKNYEGLPTSQSKAKLEQAVAQGDAEFGGRFNAQVNYYKKMAQDMYDGGLIGKDKLDDYLSSDDYIRIQRDMDDLLPSNFGSSQSRSLGSTKATQKRTGSKRDILSPSETTAKRTQEIQLEIQRNKAANNTIDLLEEQGLATKVPEAKNKNVVKRMRDGKVEYYEVHPDIKKVMDNVNPFQLGVLAKIVSFPVRVLRAGATALSAPFTVTNYLRDQASSALLSKSVISTHNPQNIVRGLASATRDAFGESQHPLWKKFEMYAGDQTIFDELRNAKNTKKVVREIRRGQTGKMYNAVTQPIRTLEDLNSITEKATRFQNFKGIYEKTLKATGDEDSAIKAAVLAARQNSVDFQRSSSFTRTMNLMIPYFNAGVQGSRSVARSFKTRPVATSMKSVGFVALPSVAITMYNYADEERRRVYESIDEYQKEDNYIIVGPNPKQNPDGSWEGVYKIPKPQGYRELTDPVRDMTEAFVSGESVEDVAGMFTDTINGLTGTTDVSSVRGFAGSLVPQQVKPAVQAYANTDLYTGNKIVPEYMEAATEDPTKQAYDSTSGMARMIAEQIGVSPIKVEKFFADTAGSLGRYGVNAVDNALNKAGKIPEEQIGGRSVKEDFSRRLFEASGDLLEENKSAGRKYFESVDRAKDSVGLNTVEKDAYNTLHPSKEDFLGQELFDENKRVSKYIKAGIYLQHPKTFEVDKAVDAEQRKQGQPGNPLYDLKGTQLNKVLLKQALPPGASDPELDALWKEEWYQDYKNNTTKFYDSLKAKLAKEGKTLPSDSTYPTTQPKVQSAMDAYSALPKGTGARSNWIKANPEAWNAMTAQWQAVDNWENKERGTIGLNPLTDTEGNDLYGNGSGSYGSGGGSTDNTPTAAYTKVPQGEALGKVSFKSSSPEIRTKKSVKRRPRPKLQLKKSMV